MTRHDYFSAYASHLRSIVAQLNAAKEACQGALMDPNCPDSADDSIRQHAAQCDRYLQLFEREFLPKFEALEREARRPAMLL
jgi:hypothetical protein